MLVLKYKMIHTKTSEEISAEEAELIAEDSEKMLSENAFAKTVPGWQYLLMIAIGFLIVYLGAAKGFEPLLLISTGFGTILVNIPGAGMENAPDGMLNIIYNAGVGNEFFPLLLLMITILFLPTAAPLIGSAGVSAVPMAARVANKVGQEYDPMNFLLMHAMGPNVSNVIGTAIAAGVFIATFAH